MHLIVLPDELTLLHLLELQEAPPLLHDLLGIQARDRIEQGRWEEGIALSEQALVAVHRDRYAAALSLLYKAEGLRRLGHWEDALDTLHRALNWLELQVSQVARYNEALTAYMEGIIHYTLQSQEKTLQTFAYAQETLVESQRFWGFINNASRVGDCQNVIRWMAQLLDVRPMLPPTELSIILPMYEWNGAAWVRIGVFPVSPFQVAVPSDVLAAYLPPGYVPIELDVMPFMQLDPTSAYAAIRITRADDVIHGSQVGDALIVEMAPSSALAMSELSSSSEHPFIRRSDGRIAFRPRRQDTRGLSGIPRLLIRGKEEAK